MLLTEEQAQEKWCPFALTLGRLIGRDEERHPDRTLGCGPQNRGSTMGGPLDACRCIASGCMAWSWDRKHNDEAFEEAKQAFMENADYEMPQRPAFRDSAEWQEAMNNRLGWCGLCPKDDE